MTRLVHTRRGVLSAAAATAVAATGRDAWADAAYAAGKTVAIAIPYAPGGASDVSGRILTEGLSRRLGGSFVMDHRPGASTTLAARYVARAKPDGTTLLLGTGATFTLVPHVQANLGYDPLRDFSHITQLTEATLLFVVNPRWPNLQALIAHAKQHPGELSGASWGVGSVGHLMLVDFMRRTGTEFIHVPYSGPTAALTDVIAGRVDMMATTSAPALPQIEAGRLRLLGVLAANRIEAMPEVPTLAEQGVDLRSVASWWGLSAPAGTPAAIITALNDAVAETFDEPATVALLRSLGNGPVTRGPDAMRTRIAEEFEATGALARIAGLRAE